MKFKEEHVCEINNNNQRECWRCGAGNFTLDQLSKCKASNARCNYCGRMGHLEKVCNQEKRDSNLKVGSGRGFGERVQRVDPDESGEDEEGDYMVLKVDSVKDNSKPFYMEGFINGNKFKAMIDTGCPVTIFELNEIKQIMKKKNCKSAQWLKKRDVDFNGKHVNLLVYVFCELQVNDSYIKKARILIAKNGTKLIIGGEWLTTPRYKLA